VKSRTKIQKKSFDEKEANSEHFSVLQRREEHCQSNLSVGRISRAESSAKHDQSAAL